MPPFENIEIRNFRCFRDFRLEDLGRVNLIAGENSTGKSALLESAFLLSGARNIVLVLKIGSYRGIQEVAADSVSDLFFKPLFHQHNFEQDISISGRDSDGERAQVTLRLQAPSSAQVDLPNAENGSDLDTESSQPATEALQLIYEGPGDISGHTQLLIDQDGVEVQPRPPSPPYQSIFLAARRNISASADAKRLSKLEVQKSRFDLADALRIVEPRLEQVLVGYAGEPLLYGDIGVGQMLPLSVLGDGLSRLASLLLAIVDASGGLVLADEIENGLHHSILPDVWEAVFRTAEEFNTQVFATTHSFECIEAAHSSANEAGHEHLLNFFRTEFTDDQPSATRYDWEALTGAIESGIEVR